jgi:hypothetical protein
MNERLAVESDELFGLAKSARGARREDRDEQAISHGG